MTQPVAVVGMGADGPDRLGTRARAALAMATWIAGGRRHLELLRPFSAEAFVIRDNIDALVRRLERRAKNERCVVVASGDPLFYGVGQRLLETLGPDQVVVEPAVSSLQLAFARAGMSWHDAAIASIHGRPLARTLLPLLGQPKIGLFTQDGSSPAAVARFFCDRDLSNYEAWICENLGADGERITKGSLADLIGQQFAPLNFLVLRRGHEPPPVAAGQGARLSDDAFAVPDSGPVLLTHADVRALVVARFADLPEGPLWDIGAGLGGIAVSLARTFPDREVVAIERSPTQAGYLRINRSRFGVYNLRIIEGEAPECLAAEEPPAGVFLGGSGSRLASILEAVFERLVPGGTLVGNFIGLENLTENLKALRSVEWPHGLTHVQVSQGGALAGLTTFVPQRPVWIVQAVRPRSGPQYSGSAGEIG